ncbi:cohesin domain-containing protein [Halopiger aswanensis]|uniref:Cohesin domain-containing protein n=1 Tax=Halopiger aswanensis TaxID=148449 RepID=A0A419VY53_9EURY|nr:cohesin domain-containing protein [Halopiger aswanensis]RKD88104.1 cohesin domain-containing protein [Halopiger aswanensis]
MSPPARTQRDRDSSSDGGLPAAHPDSRAIVAGRAVALALLLVAATALAVPALVSAGDRSAVIRPSPSTVEADPGETFSVEIELQSDGGHGGVGVGTVDFVARYHPDYLEITDLERGPWLEQGEETTVRAERTLAHADGTAVLEQRRDPPAGGATGNAMLATMTVRVADDAPPATTTINVSETGVEPARGWPLALYAQDVTVEIDGGGESVPASDFDHPDPDPDALETTADDGASTGDANHDDADSSENSNSSDTHSGSENGATDEPVGAGDEIPGFTAIIAGLTLGFCLVRTLRHS